jgi:hypothetical protein
MHVNSLLAQPAFLSLPHRRNDAFEADLRVFLEVVATGQAEGAGELFVLDECAVLQTLFATAIPNRVHYAQLEGFG